MKKKYLALMLSVLCTASLTGCAGASANVGQTQTPETTEASAGDTAAENVDAAAFASEAQADGTLMITGYDGRETAVTIPAAIDGKTVTAIGDYAFECNPYIESVMLPDTLTAIGRGAFSGCNFLKTINLPAGITIIGDGAFLYCQRLNNVTLPASLTSLGEYVFAGCIALSDVALNDTLTTIPDRTFYQCEALTGLAIPDSVTAVGKSAFAKCTGLTAIELPAAVETVGDWAFSDCEALTTVTYPCREIGQGVFERCRGLQSIIFENGLTSIGDRAFCEAGTAPVVPAEVTSLGEKCFAATPVTTYTVEEGNETYTAVDGVIFTKDMTTLVAYPGDKADAGYTVPDSVTTIGPDAFYNAYQLTSLTLPAGVTAIGARAFSYTSLGSLDLPAGIEEIPDEAFAYCGDMTTITLPEGITAIGKEAFSNCGALETMGLPSTLTAVGAGTFDCIYSCEMTTAPGLSLENGVLYNDALQKALICLPTLEETTVTLRDGTAVVGENAFAGHRNVKAIILPASVTEIEDNAFASPQYLVGPEDSAAAAFAREHQLGIFTALPDVSVKTLSLAGDETTSLLPAGASLEDTAFSTKDPTVASVDENGVLTAHKAGTCDAYAVTGNVIFAYDVTVTSDGTSEPPAGDGFDRSGYRLITTDTEADEWSAAYREFNPAVPDSDERNLYNMMYKGQMVQHFRPMVAAQSDRALANTKIDDFGEDFRDMYRMIDHGCETELARFRQPEDVIVMTGIYDYQLDDAVGSDHSLKAIQQAVGNEFVLDTLVSTSLLESAADSFGQTIFVIYGKKEAFDEIGCGYIDLHMNSNEKEILMSPGARCRVLGAGVTKNADEYHMAGDDYRLYVELELLGKG
ncbi:MAG: leucine-rich repeat protein [Lachnospiraceae bacterium]|nr:leucine-rich repeat protein [Lachnospiraceae bacterium]